VVSGLKRVVSENAASNGRGQACLSGISGSVSAQADPARHLVGLVEQQLGCRLADMSRGCTDDGQRHGWACISSTQDLEDGDLLLAIRINMQPRAGFVSSAAG